jgi:hypothetical protein
MSIAKPVNGNSLDERRIKSIVHQIDQRCRNIASKIGRRAGRAELIWFTQSREGAKCF